MSKNETILSLDASTTSTGWAIFAEDELIDYGTIKPNHALVWTDRIMEEWIELSKIIQKYKPVRIVSEAPPAKEGKLTLQKLGAVQGMVLSLCARFELKVDFLLPSQWRGKLGIFDGTRDGTKRDVLKQKAIETANKTFGLTLNWVSPKSARNEDDVAEAILIGWSEIKPRAFGK